MPDDVPYIDEGRTMKILRDIRAHLLYHEPIREPCYSIYVDRQELHNSHIGTLDRVHVAIHLGMDMTIPRECYTEAVAVVQYHISNAIYGEVANELDAILYDIDSSQAKARMMYEKPELRPRITRLIEAMRSGVPFQEKE